MKTIFTLLASLTLSASVFATDAKSKSALIVKSLDKNDIRVVLDGRNFDPGYNSLMIEGLDAGYHTVQVYSDKADRRRDEAMIYNSAVTINAKAVLNITIDCSGQASIAESKMHIIQDGIKCYDFATGNNSIALGSYDSHKAYTTVASSMNDRQFNQLLQSIGKEWLESNKLKSAEHIVSVNTLTAAQVKQLVQLFTFETNKLELAKQAYATTLDKENYSIISDLFDFSGSKAELARCIRNF